MWTGVKAWKELTETWLQTPFTEIDAAILEKNVTMYQRLCHQAVKGLPSNPVAKRLKARRKFTSSMRFHRAANPRVIDGRASMVEMKVH